MRGNGSQPYMLFEHDVKHDLQALDRAWESPATFAFDRREKTGPDSVRENSDFLTLERIKKCPKECV